jgi:hypothetical protein
MTITPDLDRIDAVVAYVRAHPEEYDQETWLCCIAGHAARMDGWKPYPTGFITSMVIKDGTARTIVAVAADLLGLDEDTAYDLFDVNNTLEDISRIQAELHAAYRPDGAA